MEVVHSYCNVPDRLRGGVLAIGNFDGVHRGHQAVVDVAKQAAHAADVPVGVMSFEPHPLQFFRPEPPLFRLTSEHLKTRLFAALGLDMAAILPFDKALSSLSGRAFIKDILVAGFAVSHVVVGYDFHFGKGRDGNTEMLRAEGQRLGFTVSVVQPVRSSDDVVFSSTRIREALMAGQVCEAARLLGYWWCVEGEVIAGAGRGDGMGYPTANIALQPGQNLRHGIYAVRIVVDGQAHDGAAYLGTRPTFDDGAPLLEIYIFDFKDRIYGKTVRVSFLAHIRDDRKFADVEALKRQMDEDCAACLAVLREAEARRCLPPRAPLAQALLTS